MAERQGRRERTPIVGRVVRTERVTPHMVRVVLGVDGFTAAPFTDQYVKLLFPQDGEDRPTTRTYTVRRWDQDAQELTLDVVEHGDRGLAGPWASRVKAGEEISFFGPGGAYAPDPAADWHLLAGDESALPAIAAALEQLPADASGHALIEVSDPDEEQKLEAPGGVTITWLHRGEAVVGEKLVAAVTEVDFAPDAVHAFVHGEATFVKELRRFLFLERKVPRDRVSISGYWRLGHDEDGWQSSKREWNRQVEAEQDS